MPAAMHSVPVARPDRPAPAAAAPLPRRGARGMISAGVLLAALLFPAAPWGGGAARGQEPGPIRVRVELVSVPVTVRDARGELVYDLQREDFRVFDNGAEQAIESFEAGAGPLSVVFLVETSSRIEPLLPAIRRTGILFTQMILGEQGDGAVVTFDSSIEVAVPFTRDHERIEAAIASLPAGHSGARLHDALSRAVDLLRTRTDRRRVIVVLAEAADTGSETKLGEVLRAAQLHDITIFSVGLSTLAATLRAEPRSGGPPAITPPGTFPMPPRPGTPQTPTTEAQARGQADLLGAVIFIVERAANAAGRNSLELATLGTGGLHLPTFRDRSIENALQQIGAELHAQYVLTYRPSGEAARAGGFHKIEVEVDRRGASVRARPGYYVGPR